MTVLTDLFAAPSSLSVTMQHQQARGHLAGRIELAKYSALDRSVQIVLSGDESRDVLTVLLDNENVDRDIKVQVVYQPGPHQALLQKHYAARLILLPDEQVQLAREGSVEGRTALAQTMHPLCYEAQEVLAMDLMSSAATLLRHRSDLYPEIVEKIPLRSDEILKFFHRDPSLGDARHLTYSYYAKRYPQGLERFCSEKDVDVEALHALGPTWEGDFASLVEACHLTNR